MEAKTRISVVVCTYNRANLLPKCLLSLAGQTIGADFYEVIVVNNGSTDGTQKIAEEFALSHPNFRVAAEGRQGLSHARNRGYREAKGEYVAYIDDDAMAFPDWLERILSAFDNVEPGPAAIGGEILPWYETAPPDWFTDDFEVRSWGESKGFLSPPRAPYGFSGSNMSFRRPVLVSSGGFSGDLGMVGKKSRFGEETELFSRIYKEHPWFWYDPEIRVRHLVPARNMTVCYRLKRAYLSGVNMAAVNGRSAPGFLMTLLSVIIKTMTLLFRAAWLQRPWKRSFVKEAAPIANAIGHLIGLLSPAVKQADYGN